MAGYPLNPQGNRPTPAGWTNSVADPASPAGGNGPGSSQSYSRRDPDEGSWFWGAVHGAEHFAESAYHAAVGVVHDAEDTAIRVAHVAQAIYLAIDYADDAIRDKIRMDVEELKKAFIPGLVMSLGILAITTLAGATIAGILVGALTAGAGAVPAAVAGGELGLDAGFLILDAMGIGFLLRTVFDGISQVFTMVKSAMEIAWNAGSNPNRPPMADIQTAAYGLAAANAEMVSLLLQGVLIWILSESAVARAGKLAKGFGKVGNPAALASRGMEVMNELRAKPAEMRASLREGFAELAALLRRTGELTRGLADFIEAKFELILKNVTEDAGKQAEQLKRTGAGGGAETEGNNVGVRADTGNQTSQTVRKVSKRDRYMGRTPGKNSRTGVQVRDRMRAEGRLRDGPDGEEFLNRSDNKWYSTKEADMGHYPQSAVDYWNQTGKYSGAKSPPVRQWMLNPDNYELQHYSGNRSAGASSSSTYSDPAPPQ